MKLFHITPKRNLDSIARLGLIAGHSQGITCERSEWKTIFLTPDPARILEEQCGSSWIERNEPAILIVDTRPYLVRPMMYGATFCPIASDFEFECDGPIAREHLRLARTSAVALSSNWEDICLISGEWGFKSLQGHQER